MTVPVVPPVALPTGADVLNELRAALTKYVILPSDADADGITLWIAATHAQQVLEHASRLVVKSPLKRCGKTRALEVISETAHRPAPHHEHLHGRVGAQHRRDGPPHADP